MEGAVRELRAGREHVTELVRQGFRSKGRSYRCQVRLRVIANPGVPHPSGLVGGESMC
jgi:hypothetical protein